MEANQYAKNRIVTLRPNKLLASATAIVLSALLLVGCTGGVVPADATATLEPAPPVEEATATPEVSDTETMTETEGMDDSETMTDTEDMDDSETMTDTEGMDDSEGITDTEEITDTETTTN